MFALPAELGQQVLLYILRGQVACTSGSPAAIRPMTEACANPPFRNSSSAWSTVFSAQATSNPPDVCGSMSKRCSASPRFAPIRTRSRSPQLRPEAPVTTPSRSQRASTPSSSGTVRAVDRAPQPGPRAHLEHMAQQAEAGDVGQRMHARQFRQRVPGRVELRRARRSCAP